MFHKMKTKRFIKTKLLVRLRYLGGVEVGISCNSVLHLVTLYTEMPLICRNQSLQRTWNRLLSNNSNSNIGKKSKRWATVWVVLSCVSYILIRSAMHAYTHQHRYMTTNANVMQRTYSNTKKKWRKRWAFSQKNALTRIRWCVCVCLRERKTEVNKCIQHTRTCTRPHVERDRMVWQWRTRIKYAVNVLQCCTRTASARLRRWWNSLILLSFINYDVWKWLVKWCFLLHLQR